MRFTILSVFFAAALGAGLPGAVHAQAQADAQACLAKLRPGAPANGVALDDFDRYTAGASLLPATVSAAKGQPEVRETWWDYLAKTVDDERVADGRQVLEQERTALADISSRYGVDPEALVAIFGIETNFGVSLGKTRVLDAWLTRSCTEGKPLWTRNVYASIRLLRDGVVDPDGFIGSWSGAFGMTQFIPTSFFELAADGDGDGKVDLYHSKADALASTASHLSKRGAQWVRGVPPVIEVTLPQALAAALPQDDEYAGSERKPLARWAAQGVKRAAPGEQDWGDAPAYLFAPTGRGGPVFLATGNFDAILRYNQSRRYALAVSLLTDRLRGEPPLATPWPTDDPGVSRAEIRETQALLLARGYDLGGAPDGIPGAKTRAAASAEQEKLGLPTDGRIGRKLLEALRRQPIPQS